MKRLSVVMKQTVAPLQAEECNKLRRKLASFDVHQHEFREKFRKITPFQFESDHPYVRIDRVSPLNGTHSRMLLPNISTYTLVITNFMPIP